MEKKDAMLLVFFYLGKMIEGGFITQPSDGVKLTEKGFDAAYDIYKSGAKLSKVDIVGCLSQLKIKSEEIQMFCMIMWDMQEYGYEAVIKRSKELEEKNGTGEEI